MSIASITSACAGAAACSNGSGSSTVAVAMGPFPIISIAGGIVIAIIASALISRFENANVRARGYLVAIICAVIAFASASVVAELVVNGIPEAIATFAIICGSVWAQLLTASFGVIVFCVGRFLLNFKKA